MYTGDTPAREFTRELGRRSGRTWLMGDGEGEEGGEGVRRTFFFFLLMCGADFEEEVRIPEPFMEV